jgi:hypothetical protein
MSTYYIKTIYTLLATDETCLLNRICEVDYDTNKYRIVGTKRWVKMSPTGIYNRGAGVINYKILTKDELFLEMI